MKPWTAREKRDRSDRNAILRAFNEHGKPVSLIVGTMILL